MHPDPFRPGVIKSQRELTEAQYFSEQINDLKSEVNCLKARSDLHAKFINDLSKNNLILVMVNIISVIFILYLLF